MNESALRIFRHLAEKCGKMKGVHVTIDPEAESRFELALDGESFIVSIQSEKR